MAVGFIILALGLGILRRSETCLWMAIILDSGSLLMGGILLAVIMLPGPGKVPEFPSTPWGLLARVAGMVLMIQALGPIRRLRAEG